MSPLVVGTFPRSSGIAPISRSRKTAIGRKRASRATLLNPRPIDNQGRPRGFSDFKPGSPSGGRLTTNIPALDPSDVSPSLPTPNHCYPPMGAKMDLEAAKEVVGQTPVERRGTVTKQPARKCRSGDLMSHLIFLKLYCLLDASSLCCLSISVAPWVRVLCFTGSVLHGHPQ